MGDWNKGCTCKATDYSQISCTCDKGALYDLSILGDHDLASMGTMAGNSDIKGEGNIGHEDREV